ncbi:MAG: hypothetical protein QW074_03390 [Candidatus Caldarchaeum sp.]
MAEDDNYIEDYISMQGLYDSLASQGGREPVAPPRPRGRSAAGGEPDYDSPKGLISAKTAFALVLFSSLATAALNPSWLLYSLPLTVFIVSFLSLAKRGSRREPRRLRFVDD